MANRSLDHRNLGKDTELQIAYDGDALRNATMDVRELAPALLSIGELCDRANFIANGSHTKISVYVKANFRRGSFQVHLDIVQALLATAGTGVPLIPPDIKTTGEVVKILFGDGGIVKGLFDLVKRLRGKPIPSEASKIVKGGNVTIDFSQAQLNNVQVTVARETLQMYEDAPSRKLLEQAVKPLKQEGIDVFEVKEANHVLERVERDDVQFFEVPPSLTDDKNSSEATRTVMLEIVTVSFKDRYRWRFSDGHHTFMAPIEDTAFFKRIDDGDRFGKGDILRVELYERQWRDNKGLHAKYSIVRVLEVIRPPKQLDL